MKKVKMLFVIYTNKCNSKCRTCDYWKITEDENKLKNDEIFETVKTLYDKGLETVLFTGGEPLVEARNLFELCEKIKKECSKVKLRLITNGLLLKKYKEEIKRYFDVVVLSFDAANDEEYKRNRGVYGYKLLTEGIKELKEEKAQIEIRLRTLVHRNNFKYLNEIIDAGKDTGANTISFLPVDIQSDIAFGGKTRNDSLDEKLFLRPEEVKEFEEIINNILVEKEELLKNGFIIENGENLKRVFMYYKDCLHDFKIKCSTPIHSITIDVSGNVSPCFFVDSVDNIKNKNIIDILNSDKYVEIEKEILSGCKKECKNCIGVL